MTPSVRLAARTLARTEDRLHAPGTIRWRRAPTSAIVVGMGVRTWFFLRPRQGELRPLAQTKVDAFFFRDGRLPVDDDGLVRYAEVTVRLEDRRAVEVLRVAHFQCRARTDGTLDRQKYMELMATAGEAASGGVVTSTSPPGVVRAEHRFAQRRLDHLSRWKPTKAEVEVLRELVNRRAGHDLL